MVEENQGRLSMNDYSNIGLLEVTQHTEVETRWNEKRTVFGTGKKKDKEVDVEISKVSSKLLWLRSSNARSSYQDHEIIPTLSANTYKEMEERVELILNRVREIMKGDSVLICGNCKGSGVVHKKENLIQLPQK